MCTCLRSVLSDPSAGVGWFLGIGEPSSKNASLDSWEWHRKILDPVWKPVT